MRSYSVGRNLTANTKTTLFTVPTKQVANLNLLFASNSTASTKHFSAWWYDKSAATEVVIVASYDVSAKSFLKFDNAYITLEDGDEIRVQSETGSTVSVIITVEVDNAPAVSYTY
jgi:hypothetical protein